jgi:phage tail sheath protein FI
MPVTPTYPGVYVEEIPSGVRTITGVATSVAAFIDFFRQGPMNEPVQIFSMADFEREFGGLDPLSEASYAIQQFFLNGGAEAWVVRVASGSTDGTNTPNRATVFIDDLPLGTLPTSASAAADAAALIVSARNEGRWGNSLRVQVDYDTLQPGEFNLLVSETVTVGNRTTVARTEVFRNLSMDGEQTNFAGTVVNDPDTGSRLIQVAAAGTARPLINGTLSGEHAGDPTISGTPRLIVALANGAGTTTSGPLPLAVGTGAQPLTAIAPALQAAIRSAFPANPAFSGAQVEVVRNRLHVRAGPGDPRNRLLFAAVPGNEAAASLRLTTGITVRRVTLSGAHAGNPSLPAAPQVEVEIGGATETATLAFGAAVDLPGEVPLADVAPVLQQAIRDAGGGIGFTGARVLVQEDRLVVVPGGASVTAEVSFEAGPTADALLLTAAGGAVVRRATHSGEHAGDPVVPASPALAVTVGDVTLTASLAFAPGTTLPAALPLATVAPVLQGAIRAADPADPAFAGAVVLVLDDRLLVVPGGDDAGSVVAFAATGGSDVAADLLLGAGATVNLQEYTLGQNAIADTAQIFSIPGSAGLPPDATALIGSEAEKTGLYALEDVDLFNLLCLPRIAELPAEQAQAVTAVAQAYCERRRAFFLMDTPRGIDEPREIRSWMAANNSLRHRNAALFFPRLRVPDPLNEFRLRSVGASGTLAGLFARIDGARGVWKAPAGTEATLRNVPALEYVLSDQENGALNPLGINGLRNFPVYGSVSWGARTLEGSDQQASEWKYIPVRRLALFLEESLYRGTQWVVFEPNDEPLWAQIRLNVGAFMQTLFRQGAFAGRTPREAYLVKCDRETTTQNDVDRGIVNVLVGFAPLKPAEFVIIKFQQLAGQLET